MAVTITAAQVISSVYDAFKRGDVNYILQQVAPDAIWRQSRTLPWGGDYRGPQGAAEFFQKLDAAMETVSFEVQETSSMATKCFRSAPTLAKAAIPGRPAPPSGCFDGV